MIIIHFDKKQEHQHKYYNTDKTLKIKRDNQKGLLEKEQHPKKRKSEPVNLLLRIGNHFTDEHTWIINRIMLFLERKLNTHTCLTRSKHS